MGRRAARTDSNQSAIAAVLRRAGATVQSLAALGRGVPDLMIGFEGRNYLAEVKDGGKPASARKLTDDEQRWFDRWTGQAAVIETALDALALIGIERERAVEIVAEHANPRPIGREPGAPPVYCPEHGIRLRFVLRGNVGHCGHPLHGQYIQGYPEKTRKVKN